jgi:uncharacterized membrane protein YuzA (DUF378 family)
MMGFIKRLEPLWLLIVIAGALSWAVIALFSTNVLSEVFGTGDLLKVAYCVIGFAGLMFVPRLLSELGATEHMHFGDRMHPRGA